MILMVIFYLLIVLVYCQLQLNPISGQNFFFRIQDVFNTTGYQLHVLQPNLGFQIQGGLITGGINQTIQTQSVISTSLYQKMNLIGLLELDSYYSVSTVTYSLSGQLNNQTYLFNVSTTNQTCQNFQIIGYVNIILHCINMSNGQVIIYFYNNTYLVSLNTGYTISNISQLQSMNIQNYYTAGSYNLYFIYINKFQSYILYTQLYNNTLTPLIQIWSQPAQYIQIFVSFEQEVFALQFNYLLYQYKNYTEKLFSQNGSNWIAMDILYDEYDEFLIILVNNYTLFEFYFDYAFYIFSKQQLPETIQQTQIFSDINYIFILTPNQTLVYQYQGDSFQFYQYSYYSIYNQLNLYSSLSNMIINLNTTGIQFFQLLDYYLYNNQPSQSGFITIGMFNQNDQMIQNQSIYINVLSSYLNQICPNYVNFNGDSYLSNNSYYQQVQLSQFYIGSNLTYNISQTSFNGIQILNQLNYKQQNSQIQIAALYSISQLNAFLNVQILTKQINFVIMQYRTLTQDFQQISQDSIHLAIGNCEIIHFQEYENGTIMSFLASVNYIYAFEIIPTVGVNQYYIINLTDALNNSTIGIISVVTIDNLLILLTPLQQVIYLQFFTSYYVFLTSTDSNYSQLVGYQYQQFFIFGVKLIDKIYVDIYVWEQEQILLLETLSLSFVDNVIDDVFIIPVKDGIFVCYDQAQIRFYEKSQFTQNNIGTQVFFFQIETSNIFSIKWCQSDQYLYYLVKYNNEYYINIYQGTQILNSLYQSIYIDATQTSIYQISLSATTDFINKCDYLSFNQNYSYIYVIPHQTVFQQFPNNQYTIQYSINNTINISNLNNSYQFYVNYTILQQNIQITSVKEYTQIINNQTNGSISINPYQYFSGVIQAYNISCAQCLTLSFNSIITNNYIFFNEPVKFSTYYIQDNIQYLYNLNPNNLFLLTSNISNQQGQRNMTQYITNLANLPFVSVPILLFLEIQTNQVVWLINNESTLQISTIVNDSTQNQTIMTIPGFNGSNEAQFAVYNNGILQIFSTYFYYCYYFYIENQTMQLMSILENVSVDISVVQKAVGFLDLYQTEDNHVFGIQYLNNFNTLQFILLDVSMFTNGSYKLNAFKSFPLEEIVSYQKDFQFQYVQQYGQSYILNNTSFLYLAYTTLIDSGILELQFKGTNLVLFEKVCSIFIINSTYSNNYLNLLSLYGNQIAIMNQAQNHENSSLTLQLYLIDLDQCQNVQPYSFQILGNFNSSDNLYSYSLNFLNSNQLLLSLNGYTSVIEINQLLEITYSTIVNSTITLTAQNPYYSLNQSVQISFSPFIIPNNSNNTDNTNTVSHHYLQWYWILLITIGALLVIGVICLLLYLNIRRNNDESNYQQFSKNEIEIKSQNMTDL